MEQNYDYSFFLKSNTKNSGKGIAEERKIRVSFEIKMVEKVHEYRCDPKGTILSTINDIVKYLLEVKISKKYVVIMVKHISKSKWGGGVGSSIRITH